MEDIVPFSKTDCSTVCSSNSTASCTIPEKKTYGGKFSISSLCHSRSAPSTPPQSDIADYFSDSMDISSPIAPIDLSPPSVDVPLSVSCSGSSASNCSKTCTEPCNEQPKKKQCMMSSAGILMSLNNARNKVQNMVVQACDVKMQKLSVIKSIFENQNQPDKMKELKPRLKELILKETDICTELKKTKEQSKPALPTCESIIVEKLAKVDCSFGLTTPKSGGISPLRQSNSAPNSVAIGAVTPPPEPLSVSLPVLPPQPSPASSLPASPLPLIPALEEGSCPVLSTVKVKGMYQVWRGVLAVSNCPAKGKTREISVSACVQNVCAPNVSPLFAQFEGTSVCATTWPAKLLVNGVCSSQNLHFFKKYSKKMFVIVPADDPENMDRFDQTWQQLLRNNWAAVVELADSTLLLTPSDDKTMVAIVLSRMNVTYDVNKAGPTSRNEAERISAKYHEQGELSFEDRLVDGFYDPGRCRSFLSQSEYQSQPLDASGREILLVDSTIDGKLASYMQRAQEMLNRFTDLESQARVLALFVSNCLGGDRPSSAGCLENIGRIKACKKKNVVMIGEITTGVCRHRAVLYKYFCDRLNIPCSLNRGTYQLSLDDCASPSIGAHAWNIIKLGTSYFCVDIMHEPTELYSMTSEKAKHYTQATFDAASSTFKNRATPVLQPELSSRRFVRLPNLREKAVFHEKLGSGNSSVYRITLGGLSCALKKINIGKMTEQQRQYALQEVQVMEMLQHENIIHYLGHELLEDKHELHILMELFPLSLGQLIQRRRQHHRKFTSAEIRHLSIEILNGMMYLHGQKIIHRDLKPDNILVDLDENDEVNKVKITDFGVCKILTNANKENQTRVGTELYMAPEQNDPKYHCSPMIDIWSFGMILVELLTLHPPYANLSRAEALDCLRQNILPSLGVLQCADEQRIGAIISKCLEIDPMRRATAEELVIMFFKLQCR
eukprot:TRINITY_DN5290_c0_g1_i1.p1 TRINITY_DN5290_c0_g1~~TRINITY_DN5290_c0_g1_i1.p1  ORF type:complete len:952 (+),score=258.97 TRINITY_DN5290_c0_g1_i1:288-3143(+)